jgi:hypothetical protein
MFAHGVGQIPKGRSIEVFDAYYNFNIITEAVRSFL